MSGNRHASNPHAKPPAAERKETPIRTFSEEYSRNPTHNWVVMRINSLVSRDNCRGEELARIRSAIYDFSVKVECTKETMEQLAPLLSCSSMRPELRAVWELRAAAALMLGGMRSKDAVPALVSAFENEGDLRVKEAICLALGATGLEGAPLRRFSEALVAGLEAARWEGPEKKEGYMNFLRNAFYEAQLYPPVILEPWQEEFLTRLLSGMQPGSEGPENWHVRASAALLLGASEAEKSFSVLPNLVASIARDSPEVGACSRMAAVRIGRGHFWRSDVRAVLSSFLGPSPGECHAPGRSEEERMAEAAKEILVLINDVEQLKVTSPGRPSLATIDLLSPRQKFIGLLRAARESGDYSMFAREFPAETVVRNMLDGEYVRISKENLPELKAMFSNYLRAAARNPEAYHEIIGALIDAAVEGLLDAKKRLGQGSGAGMPQGQRNAAPGISPEEAHFLAILREAYQKGDYSALVGSVKMPDAIRMLVRSSSANLEERHIPFLKRLTSDVIRAGIRARGPKAFHEAAETLYEMALTGDLYELYIQQISQAIANLISTSKRPGR